MSDNTTISSNWASFRKLWIIIAMILFLLLLLLLFLGYGPGGEKCNVSPTTVEKTVEVEKLVDNPDLVSKISLLEKENSKIAGLMTTIKGLETGNGQIAGLNAKIKELETGNSKISGLMSTIKGLETDNGQIAGLQAKIKELEAGNANISGLMSTIKGLETDNNQIAALKARIKELENAEPKIKIVEKIVEKIVKVPVTPSAPVAPIAPATLVGTMPDMAKLYFDVGSAEFPADVDLSLSSVLAYLRNNATATVVVSGFHDSTGSLDKNIELSKQRAQAVVKLLQDSGIPAERMKLEDPRETTGSGSPEEARRVEVKISN